MLHSTQQKPCCILSVQPHSLCTGYRIWLPAGVFLYVTTGVSDASPATDSAIVCMPCIVQAAAYFSEQLNESLVDALLEYGEKQLVSMYTCGDSYSHSCGYGICHGKVVQLQGSQRLLEGSLHTAGHCPMCAAPCTCTHCPHGGMFVGTLATHHGTA